MTTGLQHSYTATGIVQLDRGLPVEAIGTALMDGAADLDENSAVSIDIDRSRIEIEVLVLGTDEPAALLNAKTLVNAICEHTTYPVEFAENRRPRPSEWHLIDHAADSALLAPA